MMPGAEYLTAEVLRALWDEIGEAFSTEHAARTSKRLSPSLATYTSRLSADGEAQHQPLGQALRE